MYRRDVIEVFLIEDMIPRTLSALVASSSHPTPDIEARNLTAKCLVSQFTVR